MAEFATWWRSDAAAASHSGAVEDPTAPGGQATMLTTEGDGHGDVPTTLPVW